MDARSDIAELSVLRTTLDDLARRVESVAERYASSPDSAVAAELFAAERSILAVGRSLRRAQRTLEGR